MESWGVRTSKYLIHSNSPAIPLQVDLPPVRPSSKKRTSVLLYLQPLVQITEEIGEEREDDI